MAQYQQLYDNNYLKPQPVNSRFSEQDYDIYKAQEDEQIRRLTEKDWNMKYRIRVMRVISRVIALLISIAVVTPLAVTITKYLETRDTHYDVNGEQTSPWPDQPITVYTYVYFGVSTVSLILEAIVLLSYCHGVGRANNADTVSTTWSWIVIVANTAIWIAAVAIYRYGKHKVDDKWRDLWGWTCGQTAAELQPFVKNIRYKKYCNVQDASFYAGLVQIGASLLTGIIFIFMVWRMRTKKALKSYRVDDAKEPLRSF